jgi:hypothetical protein
VPIPGPADAARNNAAWCDAVCSAHGRPGEFRASLWLSRHATPPYYPNLVTLDPTTEPTVAAVRELEDAGLAGAWALKDSFGVLYLEDVGFRTLVDAAWIVRRPSPGRSARSRSDLRWVRVDSAAALAPWEAAWGQSAGQPSVFPPALLRRDEVAILAGCDGDAIVAGAIANRTDDVVGLSNFFTTRRESAAARADCVEAVQEAFPGLSLVGYESASGLEESLGLGFVAVGRLRVWIKS